jgi:hypothetical protein
MGDSDTDVSAHSIGVLNYLYTVMLSIREHGSYDLSLTPSHDLDSAIYRRDLCMHSSLASVINYPALSAPTLYCMLFSMWP